MTDKLIDPDCRDGKCTSCVGGPCEHECHQPCPLCGAPKNRDGSCSRSCAGVGDG